MNYKELDAIDYPLEIVQDLGPMYPTESSKRKRRFAVFKCGCGNEFTAICDNVKFLDTTSCGCKIRDTSNIIYKGSSNPIHGMSKHPSYHTWVHMNSRCYDTQNPRYLDWGGRGISVWEEWRDNPITYCKYVEALPNAYKKGFSLDRIENDKGYTPDNIRWADKSTQSHNRRSFKNSTSKYKGVSKRKPWQAEIKINKVRHYLGAFDTEEEAKDAYNNFVILNKLTELVPLN